MSRTGRADFDQIFKSRSIPADEPYFVLRGQDDVGAEAVRVYVQLAQSAGVDVALLELAARQADAMEAWAKKKLPDVELEEHERRQLAYAWRRRHWSRGNGSAEAVAEARGRAAADPLIAALQALVAVRPSNWDDGEDPEQTAAWRAADAAIAGFEVTAGGAIA